MKLHLILSVLFAVTVQVYADEYPKETSPEIISKNYEAMHYLERSYEIGTSMLTLSTDCQETKEAAEQAVARMLAAVQAMVDVMIDDLQLGEKNESLGYNSEGEVQSSASSPISNEFNSQKKQFYWTNRCTGAQSEIPVRAKNVFSASKVFTVWFPNHGKTLNHLSTLVSKLETLSEKNVDGVKVACNSKGGANYDLDVTKKTEKTAWTEIEAVAKKRAKEKVQTDFAATQYDQIWAGPESFLQNGTTRLPQPSVVKENGQWHAKFSDTRSYTVYYKQSSEPQTGKGLLVNRKNYSVTAEATTQKDLYGKLVITVTRGCQDSKANAEKEVSVVGSDILTTLRVINGGQNTETNRLEVKDAFGSAYNPLVSYHQYRDGKTVEYFYNPCTLENHEVTKKPTVTAWNAIHKLIITSSNLNSLSDLRDSLNQKYAQEVEDPNQTTVSVDWSATLTLAALETLGSQLESDAVERFLARGSNFQCDSGKFSFACLSEQLAFSPHYDIRGLEKAAVTPSPYSEGVQSDVDSSERGVKKFTGKYTINYTVRKVLVNNRR